MKKLTLLLTGILVLVYGSPSVWAKPQSQIEKSAITKCDEDPGDDDHFE